MKVFHDILLFHKPTVTNLRGIVTVCRREIGQSSGLSRNRHRIGRSGLSAVAGLIFRSPGGLPPEKWSSLRYGFGQMEDGGMPRKRHKPEEIVAKLRQVDVLTSQGRPVAEAVRSIGVTEVTYYRWR